MLGIGGASITAFVDGTTADGPTVSTNDQNLKTWGVNNDGLITTDGSGGLTAVGLRATNGGGLIYFLTTPYLLLNNVTLNNATGGPYTCTGVGTPVIPSGAIGVLICSYFTSTATGAFLNFAPHGATITHPSDYPIIGTSEVATSTPSGMVIVSLASGQIDVKATGNCTAIFASIFGYIY